MTNAQQQDWSPPSDAKHPFYIEAPDFDECVPAVIQLHRLCDALNRFGYEAYLTGCKKTHGKYWTPILGRVTMAAHYLANKKPILIRTSVAKVRDKLPGIPILYVVEGVEIDGIPLAEGYVTLPGPMGTSRMPLRMPWLDPHSYELSWGDRSGAPMVFAQSYEKLGGKVRPEHQALQKISVARPGALSEGQRLSALSRAKCLYAYERATIVSEARLCGCPVVYVGNDRLLPAPVRSPWDAMGTTWNGSAEDIELQALVTFASNIDHHFECSQADTLAFAAASQVMANDSKFSAAWPATTTEHLEELISEKTDRAARADASKYRVIRQQYKTWRERSSLREIDGQTYAEHVASGGLKKFGAALYASKNAIQELGQTLDALQAGFHKFFHVVVFAPMACPLAQSELGEELQWVDTTQGNRAFDWSAAGTDWWLLLRSGVTLETHALLEFALAASAENCLMLYADDDIGSGEEALPHFKPDINVEWLRAFNYLGSAVAVRSDIWQTWSENHEFAGSYSLALDLINQGAAKAIGHIDTVLSHEPEAIGVESETTESDQLKMSFERHAFSAMISEGKTLGTRLIEYVPKLEQKVSIVIPTGKQLGYLTCMLASLAEFSDPALKEVILVTQSCDVENLRSSISSLTFPWDLKIEVTPDGPYSHACALNAGAKLASGSLILFADDDLECVQANWLRVLRAYFDQADIGCVGPRLAVQIGDETLLQAGPMLAGAGGAYAPYLGERKLIEEQGFFSRLQLPQDVSTLNGSCFLTRASLWAELGGFDEGALAVFHTVTDFCLRASEAGYRHVWTPISNMIHHGGKTLAAHQHRPADVLRFQAVAVEEHQQLLQRWGATLGHSRLYNRHLSLLKPYEIEPDIIIDWPSDRSDRKKVLALPITSGSGQYRIIEPLNALQKTGLARTCVVLPTREGNLRAPLAVEVARARPDRLIVQHSISDAHFQLLKEYREVCPNLFIIQMVDDLFRDLSKTHPHHKFHQREGEVRMRQAIMNCDRLIVSTQPLADAYSKYCSDVRVMPNCLDEDAWGGLHHTPKTRARLRVGWAGAAQHLGDLEMMVDVVKTLSPKVDWVFMGMCPDVLRPYVAEFHPFVSYSEYPKKLASLDLDIAIAPLEDTAFNESKSNLRLLEYGAMGWPVVCSDVYPFRTSSPPVLRVKNKSEDWISAINELCSDSLYRHKLGASLNQWVKNDFMVEKNATAWFDAIFN